MAAARCPGCGAEVLGSDPFCLRCGRTLGAGANSSPPLESRPVQFDPPAAGPAPGRFSPSPSWDPFVGTPGVVLRGALVPPFLGSFEVLDADGELRATLRRDGEGLRVLLMNYALEDAEGRPIYRIRQPEARPGIHLGGAFSLVRPDGTPEGELRMSPGLGHSTYSLDRPGRVPITAVRSGLVWKGFEIQQGSRSIAQVRADWTTRPPALSLDFQGPLGESAPRALLVAFLGFVALH